MACEIKRPAVGSLTGSVTAEVISPIGSGRVTVVALNNTAWTALPGTPLANRQGLAVQNLSGDNVLLNWSNAAAPTSHIFLASGAERFYQAKDTAILYGRLQNNASGDVHIEELGT